MTKKAKPTPAGDPDFQKEIENLEAAVGGFFTMPRKRKQEAANGDTEPT